jgi:2-hydroxymuconate-semialdehyde hydrolase
LRRLLRVGISLGAALAVTALAVAGLLRWREPDDGRGLPAGVPGRLLDVGGRRVHLVELGDGPPLLLVHGFGASTFDFEEFTLAPLARTRRAIAVDLHGFGWSERGDDLAYGWTLWSDQLAGVLDALDFERASLAGHSMGGAVATVFAARHPERVERLVLAGALYPQEAGETPLIFRALRTPGVGELLLALVDDASAPGFSDAHHARARAWHRIRGTRAAALRYVRAPGKWAELAPAYARIRAPTLVLHGTDDESVAYAAMERAVAAIPDARIVAIPGGRHFLLRDSPDVFAREVEAFLAAAP